MMRRVIVFLFMAMIVVPSCLFGSEEVSDSPFSLLSEASETRWNDKSELEILTLKYNGCYLSEIILSRKEGVVACRVSAERLARDIHLAVCLERSSDELMKVKIIPTDIFTADPVFCLVINVADNLSWEIE